MNEIRKAVLLLLASLAGAAAALAALPAIFAGLPNDHARYRTIVRLLSTTRPEIVVFGDSRGEAAVDARILTRELPGHPLAFNLCTPAQRLTETLLLADALPESVRVEVIVIGRDSLQRAPFLADNAYNALFMYGYRPSLRVRAALVAAAGRGRTEAIERSSFAEVVSARWTVRQALDIGLYQVLHPGMEREREDPFFPSTYGERVHPEVAAERLSNLGGLDPGKPPDPINVRLLREIAREARRHRRRVLLVLAPIHPALIVRGPQAAVSSAVPGASDVEVLDLTAGFPAGDFSDPLHLLSSGAPRVTSAIAQAIAGAR